MSRHSLSRLALATTLVTGVALANPAPAPGAAVTVQLCAKPGSVVMPDAVSVDIWGFALGTCAASSPAALPGPLISLTEGDSLTVQLQVAATMPEPVSFVMPAINVGPGVAAPDTAGVPPGSSKTYAVPAAALRPGVYLYESGVDPQIQLAMGLSGAIVVHDSDSGTAYGAPTGTNHDAELTLVLGELDADLNNATDPRAFPLSDYAPEYYLVNGSSFPSNPSLAVVGGERVLVRYVNAGAQNHSMALLGAHQRIIGRESRPLSLKRNALAELVTAGQTADAIVRIPNTLPPGDRVVLTNRNGRLDRGMRVDFVSASAFVSLDAGASIGGTTFADEDIVRLTKTGGAALAFDGSAAGVTTDLDAFEVFGPGNYLMSFDVPTSVPGLGNVDDSDIVTYYLGTFGMLFDGSDVGLTTDAEDVDAFEFLPADWSLLVSTVGAASVPGVSAADEDLLRFAPTAYGLTTAGTWSLRFDGSDVGLTTVDENVDGIDVLPTGHFALSTSGPFSVPGVSGADEDVVVFVPSALGTTTSGAYGPRLLLDGSTLGVGALDLDGVAVR